MSIKAFLLNPTQACDYIPESTATAIFHLCLDASFGGLLPSMQETAVAYLEQVNSDSHDIYRRVTRTALWMESTCSFLKEAQAKVQAARRIASGSAVVRSNDLRSWNSELGMTFLCDCFCCCCC